MNIRMTLDTSGISRAINQLRPLVKKSKSELIHDAAKGFVATSLEITPPASKGKTGAKAIENVTKSSLQSQRSKKSVREK